jgi:CelD/BcsL family acetyltransferase involved in cellulose biosynthesis
LAVRCFRETQELELMFHDVEEIAGKTYQRGLGVGFIDNDENRIRLNLEADKGWLRMYVLYVGAKPCAYWWGTVYKNTFHSCALGFDPAFRRYSPGVYLLMKALENLCSDGVRQLDFGLGDARYKKQFGTDCWEEATVNVFAFTIKGLALQLSLRVCSILDGVGRRMIQKTGITDWLKTSWRRRLSADRSEADENE